MTKRAGHVSPASARTLVLAACVAGFGLLLLKAWLQLAQSWTPRDDEGHAMLSIALHHQGLPLYSEIHSQYGPAWFALQGGFFSVSGIPVSHDSGRAFTFVVATLGCLAAAVAAGLATRSAWSAGLALVATPVVFEAVAAEPFHPQSLGFLLVTLAMAALAAFPARATAATLGVLAATLTLVKVNLGAFLVVGLAWAVVAPRLADARARAVSLAAVVACPLLIMGRALTLGPVLVHGLTLAGSLLALGLARHGATEQVAATAPGSKPWRMTAATAAFACGAVAAFLAFLGGEWSHGTGLGALWHGIVGQHVGFARRLLVPPEPSRAVLAFATASVVAGLIVPRLPGDWPRRAALVAASSGLLLLVLLPDGLMLGFVLPTLLWSAPLAAPTGARGPVGALACVAALLALQTHPVHGGQATMTAALCTVPLAAGVGAAAASARSRAWIAASLTALVVLQASRATAVLLRADERLVSSRVLKGSRNLRLPEAEMAVLEWLTLSLRPASSMFTVPGTWSFAFWSDRPPIVHRVATNWISALEPDVHVLTAQRLARDERCRVIRNAGLDGWWHGGSPRRTPVRDVLQERYVVLGEAGGYELLAPAGQAPSCEARLDGDRVRAVLPPDLGPVAEARLVEEDGTATPLRQEPGRLEWIVPARRSSAVPMLRLLDADGRRLVTLPVFPARER